jgi:SAM-dependent methyltransferase
VTTNVMHKSLARRAANFYRASGRSAYYFARSKLRHDPFYPMLLAENLVPAGARILDLGCAQGLLAAWLFAARQCLSEGAWDGAYPAPAAVQSYRGIDRNESEIRRARQAMGHCAEFVVGDIALGEVSAATLIVVLDVLHYLDYAAQRRLLRLIREALPMEGILLLRIGDSDGGSRARVSGWVDRLVLRMRGGTGKIYRRPLAEWLVLLEEIGFTVQQLAHQRSPVYANSLLRAFPTPP